MVHAVEEVRVQSVQNVVLYSIRKKNMLFVSD